MRSTVEAWLNRHAAVATSAPFERRVGRCLPVGAQWSARFSRVDVGADRLSGTAKAWDEWTCKCNRPRAIPGRLIRVVSVSLHTVDIFDGLPRPVLGNTCAITYKGGSV